MNELPTDPWQWPDLTTVELQKLSESDPGTGPDTPTFQYFATRRCNALRAEIDGGSGFAVLAAVRICATHGLVMPLWLVYAFNRRYDAVLNRHAASWDDPLSFGRPYPKGTNIKARRKARVFQLAVLNAINDIRQKEPNTPIDKVLFETVGKALRPPIGATLAEEFYYAAKASCRAMDISLKLNGTTDALLGPYIVRHAQNTAKNPKSTGRQKIRR